LVSSFTVKRSLENHKGKASAMYAKDE